MSKFLTVAFTVLTLTVDPKLPFSAPPPISMIPLAVLIPPPFVLT